MPAQAAEMESGPPVRSGGPETPNEERLITGP
jgi:hypothetical protein